MGNNALIVMGGLFVGMVTGVLITSCAIVDDDYKAFRANCRDAVITTGGVCDPRAELVVVERMPSNALVCRCRQ